MRLESNSAVACVVALLLLLCARPRITRTGLHGVHGNGEIQKFAVADSRGTSLVRLGSLGAEERWTVLIERSMLRRRQSFPFVSVQQVE